MSSTDGKWADRRMLDIIRRVVQHQGTSAIERQDMERFLGILSPTHAAGPRPPSYTEATNQRHNTFLPLQPLPDQRSDSGSSIRKTSTQGTNQSGSSGLVNRGQQSGTGSPQAGSLGSYHWRRQSSTGSPQASLSGSAHGRQQAGSSRSSHQRRTQTNAGVGPRQPELEGDIHDLLVPDPQWEIGDDNRGPWI